MTPAPDPHCTVRRGAYHDSVVLMGLQAALAGLPGVVEAAVVMATPANRELLAARGLLPPEAAAAGPVDLVIVVRADTDDQAGEALARAEELLAARHRPAQVEGDAIPEGAGGAESRQERSEGFRPRSLAGAMRLLPAARWVLVSVPGPYAAAVAHEALDLGRHVFLFSDNVALADEAALKQTARARGLLVLGPDCGTALLGGAGLGFSNRVRRGAIGLVGASGTGLQAVATEVHRLGAGVSQAIGTGGRDLAAEIGGATTLQALDLLRRDPETEVIVLIAKALAPPVAARLLSAARAAGKPVVVWFLGAPLPARRLGNLHFAAGSNDAAELAVALLASGPPQALAAQPPGPQLPDPPLDPAVAPEAPPASTHRYLRGLFSGGTLAAEALLGLHAALEPIFTNFPAASAQPLPASRTSRAHTLIDLGSDELTVGRPHPMIDHDLLRRRLAQEGADPEVALILLDVVLGDGAHPDPAGDLAPVIARARTQAAAAGRTLDVLAVVVGTDDDPQGLTGQIEALIAAGANVFRTVADAVDHACRRLVPPADDREPAAPPPAPVPLAAIRPPLAAVNVGLESFHTSLVARGVAAVHVDWRPPAGGDERLAALLARMKRPLAHP